MTWFWPFDSFDPVPVVLLQLKNPASVTAEFEV